MQNCNVSGGLLSSGGERATRKKSG